VCWVHLRTAVASLALQSPGLSWCRTSTGQRRFGTDYPRLFDRQNSRCLHSSARSRPTCSRTRQCWLQLWVSCTVVRRCCDCTASSAQLRMSRLDSSHQPYPPCVTRRCYDVYYYYYYVYKTHHDRHMM